MNFDLNNKHLESVSSKKKEQPRIKFKKYKQSTDESAYQGESDTNEGT